MNIFALLAAAHPGHGLTDPSTWRHYVVEPAHAMPIALALIAAVAVVFGVSRITREFYRQS